MILKKHFPRGLKVFIKFGREKVPCLHNQKFTNTNIHVDRQSLLHKHHNNSQGRDSYLAAISNFVARVVYKTVCGKSRNFSLQNCFAPRSSRENTATRKTFGN